MTEATKNKLNPHDKAERTTEAARGIMAEERRASTEKVARLRAQRLAREAADAAQPIQVSPARRPKPAKRAPALKSGAAPAKQKQG